MRAHNYLLLLKQYSEKSGWSREQLATVYSGVFPGWQETSPERDKKFGPLLGVTGLLDKGSSDFFFFLASYFHPWLREYSQSAEKHRVKWIVTVGREGHGPGAGRARPICFVIIGDIVDNRGASSQMFHLCRSNNHPLPLQKLSCFALMFNSLTPSTNQLEHYYPLLP